jgi:serine protease Do
MKERYIMRQSLFYRIVLLSMALWLAACSREVSVSTANIADARLSKDEAGNQTTTIFGPDDVFYLKVGLANAPDGTKVKAEWTAVAVEGAEANTPLDDVELQSGSATLTFDLENTGPWPAGDYKVDLYLNGKLDRSLPFRVSGGLAQAPTATPTTAPATATPEPEAASLAVASLPDVKSATIQIESQGTFVDPEVGLRYNVAGSGSGFIIDESGLAVTNNHVVTGAALIRVYVGGETRPRNARILGVSECADLAVIDIEGDGYPFLQWYDGNVTVGLDVYAAGFPLGDPEFTMTRGIVSKARADGKSDWASVAAVIEHDATINPGNSGGPLVTPDGKVVAVNYAGSSGTGQYFAIAQPQARPIIDELRQGKDVLTIGVNGSAIDDGSGLSGIWVSSVKSGSPASRAGVKGGDIITRLEGLVLATDGTMGDYCDILRTRGPEDVLAIEVLRFDSEEVLEGELNGRALERSFSFAQALSDETSRGGTGSTGAAETYSDYVSITDDTGALIIDVPMAWSDVDGSAWLLDGEEIGPSLTASPSVDGFSNTWSTPGVFFGVTDQFDVTTDRSAGRLSTTAIAAPSTTVTTTPTRSTRALTTFGRIATALARCWWCIGVEPEDGSYLALVVVQVVSEADLDALDRIMDSFIFIP